eukprot:GEMP01105561.1.p1 GENE.GEMP01105561.1~~GEMP01105561.1.p1  ORF type:complete len:173 (-),score=10.63 GEMP01105561.1:229-687(-)
MNSIDEIYPKSQPDPPPHGDHQDGPPSDISLDKHQTVLNKCGCDRPFTNAKKICNILHKPENLNENNDLKIRMEQILGKEELQSLMDQKWPNKSENAVALIGDLLKTEFCELKNETNKFTLLKKTAIMLKYPPKNEICGKKAQRPTCKKNTT